MMRSPRLGTLSSSLLSLALLAPSAAHAGWQKTGRTDGASALQAVSSPDGSHVFAIGAAVDTSGTFPSAHTHVFSSTDSGKTFTEVTGALKSISGLNFPTSIDFVDPQNGWIGLGSKVFRTNAGGTTWAGVDVGGAVNALHFFDPQNGVAVGDNGSIHVTSDGGKTWTPQTSGTDASLKHTYWSDRQHGWITGHWVDDSGVATHAIILRTTNGGQQWEAVGNYDGWGSGSIFFLPDAKTGWVAMAASDDSSSPDPYRTVAHLLKSTDGGATFTDMNLPVDVGQVSVAGFTSPVQTALIHAMYWTDAQTGHLGAVAYLGSSTSSMSGGMSSSSQTTTWWRVVDYESHDGGQTWQKTNLGTLQGSLTSGPASDGVFAGGFLFDLYKGWLVADSGNVWSYDKTCTKDSDCGDTFKCEQMQCVETAPTDGGHGTSGGTSGSADGGAQDPLGHVKDGCTCGGSGALSGALALLLVATLRASRHGRRT